MHLRPMDYVLWFASPALQVGVVIAMLRRGLHRDYPFFFNYTIIGVVAEPLLYVLSLTSYTGYYYAYWVNLGLSVIISFAVLQEIFRDAFRPYEALRDLSVILFRWSALVVLLVAVMWAINAGKSNKGFVEETIQLADRSVRLMQCGLVFFLLLFSEYLGIPRRSLLFGISRIRLLRLSKHARIHGSLPSWDPEKYRAERNQQRCVSDRCGDLVGLYGGCGSLAK